jgi:hypothetical protein
MRKFPTSVTQATTRRYSQSLQQIYDLVKPKLPTGYSFEIEVGYYAGSIPNRKYYCISLA